MAWGLRVGTRLIFTVPLHLSRCVFSDIGANRGRKREQAALGCGCNCAPASPCFHLLLSLTHLCCSCALGIGGWQHFFPEGCSPKSPSIAEDIPGGAPMLAVSPPSIEHPTCSLGWPTRAWTTHHFCLSAKLSASPSAVPVCPLPHPPAAAAKSLQSCPTLCNPIDGSPPGSPVSGILQARTLEWVAISFSNA